MVTSTLHRLEFDEADARAQEGAAYVDLRSVPHYLEAHIPGSLSLVYESGPGIQSRARDCIPLNVALILSRRSDVDMVGAAAALRARGFDVLGEIDQALERWIAKYGRPTSTDVYQGPQPREATLLDVRDPGASTKEGALTIALEQLWARSHELPRHQRVVVLAGYGVRAALAVGILERAGHRDVIFWDVRV